MTAQTPNTIVKYYVDSVVPANSGFYIFVRDQFNVYQRVEAFNPSHHGQSPNYYVLDGKIPSGLTITGTGNTYLVRSTLAHNVTINDTGTPTVIGNSGSSATVTVNSGDSTPISSTEVDTDFGFNAAEEVFNLHIGDIDANESSVNVVVGRIPAAALSGGTGGPVTYVFSALGSPHSPKFSIDSESGVITYTGGTLAVGDNVSLPVDAYDGSIHQFFHQHLGNVKVNVTSDHAPVLGNPQIAVNRGFKGDVTLTIEDLNYSDADTTTVLDAHIIYTVKHLPDVDAVVIKNDGDALAVNSTFTQQDVIDGKVVLTIDETKSLAGFALSVSNGSTQPSTIHDFAILTRAEIHIDDADAINTIDLSTYPDLHYTIDAGRGDDEISLNSNGKNRIIYEYDERSKTATDGGDVITGFKRGEDIFTLSTRTLLDSQEEVLAAADGTDTDSFADNQFIITPDLKFTGGVASVTGITLVFRENQTSSSGRMSDNSVQISFDKALTWDEFLEAIKIVDGNDVDANFDYNHLAVKSAVVLPTLLGERSDDLTIDFVTHIVVSDEVASIDETVVTADMPVATLEVVSPPAGTSFKYKWSDTDNFDIVSGKLYLKAGTYDADTKDSYTVVITAVTDDAAEDELHSVSFTIAINDLNDEKPVITSGASGSVSDEYTYVAADVVYTAAGTPDLEGGVIVWSLVDNGASDDAGLFDINDGVVTFKADATAEQRTPATNATYNFTIRADAGNQFETKEVTLTATDLNDAPTAMALSRTALVDGSSVVGTLTTTDADNDNTGVTETNAYEVTGGDDMGLFEITGDQLNLKSDATRKAIGETYDVEITVTNTRPSTSKVQTYTQEFSITEGAIYILIDGDNTEYYSNYQDEGAGETDNPEGLLAENADGSETAVAIGTVKVNGGGSAELIEFAVDNHEFTLTAGGVLSYTGTDSGDFESATNYKTIKVSFSDNGTTRTEEYRIYLSDVNEAPTTVLDAKDSSNDVITTDGNHADDLTDTTPDASDDTLDSDADADLYESGDNNTIFITADMIDILDVDDHDNVNGVIDYANFSARFSAAQNGKLYYSEITSAAGDPVTYGTAVEIIAGQDYNVLGLFTGKVYFQHDGREQYEVTADGYKNPDEARPTTFTVEFFDNADSTAAGALSTGAQTFELDVTRTNDVAVLASDNDLNTDDEGGTVTLHESDLKFTDVDNIRGEVIYKIVSVVSYGDLKRKLTDPDEIPNSGDEMYENLAVGHTFTQQDVADGKITYTHNGSNDLTDKFTYSVSNGAGTDDVIDTKDTPDTQDDDTTFTFTIEVSNVNDAPTLGAIAPKSVTENDDAAVSAGNLVAADGDAEDGFSTLSFYVTAGSSPHNPSSTSKAITKTDSETTDVVGKYGKFTFTYTASAGSVDGSVALTYALDNADHDTNGLYEGQKVSDKVKVIVYDDENLTSEVRTFKVNITGKDDPAELRVIRPDHNSDFIVSEDTTDDKAVVTFLDIVDPDSSTSSATIYYTVDGTDPDNNSPELTAGTNSTATTITVAGKYGTFEITVSSGGWTYTLDNDNTDVDALNNGQTLTEEIRFIVYDGSNNASNVQPAMITINGHTDLAAILSASSNTATIDENNKGGAVDTGIVISTTLDGLDVVTAADFTIAATTGDSTDFEIVDGNNAGEFILRAKAGQVDFDASETSYSLTISATGSNGLTSELITATITITDINDEAPVITSGNSGYISIGRDYQLGDVVYTAAGTKDLNNIEWKLENVNNIQSPFEIDMNSGVVTVKETGGITPTVQHGDYSFKIIADAGDGLTDEETVTLAVYDLNDAPTAVTLSRAALAPDSPLVGTLGIVDVDQTQQTNTYAVTGGADANLFEITGDQLSLKSDATRKAVGETYDVKVTVTNTLADDPRTIEEQTETYEQTFSITEGSLYILIDGDDTQYYSNYQDAGDGPADKPEGLLAENIAAATVIGTVIVKGDTSLITGLAVAADGNDNGEFTLAGGVLSYTGTDSGDFESAANYKTIEVSVTDTLGTSDPSDDTTRTEKYRIYLSDVNEAPTTVLDAKDADLDKGVITTDNNHADDLTDTTPDDPGDADTDPDLTETGNNTIFITADMIDILDVDDHDNVNGVIDYANFSARFSAAQNGKLYYSEITSAAGDPVTYGTAAEIVAGQDYNVLGLFTGKIYFQHDGGEQFEISSDGYKTTTARPTTFTVEFFDNADSTADGALGTGAQTFELDVMGTNDAPILDKNNTDDAFKGVERKDVVLTEASLKFTDADNIRGEVTYTIVTLVSGGVLKKVGQTEPLAIGNTFTQQDIFDGNISYEHDDTETLTDNFTYRVSDGNKYASNDSAAATSDSDNGVFTFDIDILNTDDAPVLLQIGFGKNASETKDAVIEGAQGAGENIFALTDLTDSIITDADVNNSFNDYDFYATAGSDYANLADPTEIAADQINKQGEKDIEGTYGTFTFNYTAEIPGTPGTPGTPGKVTVTYTLKSDRAATDALNAGEQVKDFVKIIASDGEVSNVIFYGVDITGTNDAPVLKAIKTAANDADFTVTEDSATDSTIIGGVLDISDVDSGDIVGDADTAGTIKIYYTVDGTDPDNSSSSELANGTTTAAEAAGKYGTFYFTRGTNGEDPKWTYELDNYNTDVNALTDTSAPLTEEIKFIVYDDGDAGGTKKEESEIQSQTITINGNTDEAPVLAALAINDGTKTGVIEDGTGDTGTLVLADLDITDPDDVFSDYSFYATAGESPADPTDTTSATNIAITKTDSETTDVVGKYGKFTFTYTAGENGKLAVSYILDDTDIDTNALRSNQVGITDTVKVIVYDGDGLNSGVKDFSVSITGTNDAPELRAITADNNNNFTVTEDATAVDTFGVVNGQALDIVDPDDSTSSMNIYYSVKTADGISNPDNTSFALANAKVEVDGLYGKFEIDRSDGNAPTWKYTLDDENVALRTLDDNATLTEEIRFIVYDDEGAASEVSGQEITINGHTDLAAILSASSNIATIDENNKSDAAVDTGIVISATLDGLDAVKAADFTITGDNSGDFEIVAGTGTNEGNFVLQAKAGQIDHDAGETSYSLTISATGSNAIKSNEITATITISDINDEAPVITSGNSGYISVGRHYQLGDVVYTAAGTKDLNNIEWTLEDVNDIQSPFKIDDNSGVVTVKETGGITPSLQHGNYSFKIIADAGDGLTDEETVTLTVYDLNDAPTEVTLSRAALAPDSPLVGTLGIVDVDQTLQTNTYAVTGGADMGLFEITGDQLSLKSDATRKAVGETYDVKVTVTNTLADDPRTTEEQTETYEQTFSITEGSLYILIDGDDTQYYSNYQDEGTGATDKPEGLLAENIAAATVIGTVIVKGDTSLITGLAVAADGNDNGEFTLTGSVLSYTGTDSGNFESETNYKTIEVSVTDTLGTSDSSDDTTRTEKYRIYLSDVNEAPTTVLDAKDADLDKGVITTDNNHADDLTDTTPDDPGDADTDPDLTETGNNTIFITADMIDILDVDDHDNVNGVIDYANFSARFSAAQNGKLYYSEITSAAGDPVTYGTAAEIVAGQDYNVLGLFTGKIYFQHDGGEQFEISSDGYKDPNDARPTSFTVEFFDNADSTADGALGTGAQTFELDVTGTNDVAVLAGDNDLNTDHQGGTVTLHEGDLKFTDVDNTREEVIYTIMATVSQGMLKKDGQTEPLVVGNTFTQQDVADGKIIYTHDNTNNLIDKFTYSVSNGAGTDNVINTLDSTTVFTLDIEVTNDDDAPTLSAIVKSANELKDGVTDNDTAAKTFVFADLTVDDGDADDGFETLSFYATAGDDPLDPSNTSAEIKKDVGTETTVATDIVGKYGTFTFTYTAGASGKVALTYTLDFGDDDTDALTATDTATDTIKIRVYDDEDFTSSESLQSFAVTITGANDAPVAAAGINTATVDEGGTTILTAADLQFTDPDDDDDMIIYKVATNPSQGDLKKDGQTAPLDVGDTFTQQDITDGKISYTHNGTENLTDHFTYSVSNGEGTPDSTPVRFDVTAGNVNDAPVLGPITPEDGSDFSVTEDSATDNDVKSAALIISDADADDGATNINIYYTVDGSIPDDNSPELAKGLTAESTPAVAGKYGTFKFTRESGGTDSKWVYTLDNNNTDVNALNTDSTPLTEIIRFVAYDEGGANSNIRSKTITISGANDAPVMANSALAVDEGGTATLTAADLQFTDVDNTDGQITYTITSFPASKPGVLKKGGVDIVVNTTTFTQQDITDGLITYTHDGNEILSDSFKYSVSDGTAAIANQTFTITVTAVNDAPVKVSAADNAVTLDEGAAILLTADDLQFTDVDNDDEEIIYTVGTAAANGNLILRVNGSDDTVITSFTQQDITDGKIFYVHDDSETTSDSFTYSVSNGGDTAAGEEQTFTVEVTPVDDLPTMTSVNDNSTNAFKGREGEAVTLTEDDLLFTDPDSTRSEIIYEITLFPDNGELKKNGVTLDGTNKTFTQQDIFAGAITYDHDGSQNLTDIFKYKVSNGGDTSGLTALTFYIKAEDVDDAPVLSPLGKNASETKEGVVEDAQAAGANKFTLSDLTVTDVDNDFNEIIFYATAGANPDTPTNTSTQIASGDSSSVFGDYGIFTFTHTAAVSGTGGKVEVFYTLHSGFAATNALSKDEVVHDVIRVIAYDGAEYSNISHSAVTVTGANDALVKGAGDNAATLNEGAEILLTAADLEFTDVDTNDTITYTVGTVAANGNLILRVSGSDDTAITSFTQQDIADSKIYYMHDDSETTSDSFTYSVSDGTATITDQTFTITVTPVNDAPVLVGDNAVTVAENATATLATTDLQFSDAENNTITYTITALASGGVLKNNGADIVVGEASATFTQAEVTNITYEHGGGEAASDGFKYTVSDGTATTGEQTFTITVTPVNDAPVLVGDNAVTVAENATATLTADDLQFSDAEGDTITYTITALASGGVLKNDGDVIVVGNANATFTQADVGKITYEHDGGEAASDSFTYSVSDGTDIITDQTFSITVTPVNDAPELKEINGGNNGSVTENAETTSASAGNLDITDADDGFDALAFYATAAGDLDSLDDLANPTNASTAIVKTDAETTDVAGKYGKFTFTYTAGSNGTVAVSYLLDNADTDTDGLSATDTASDTVKVIVYDAAGLASEVRDFTVNITGANDAPTLGAITADSNSDATVTDDSDDLTVIGAVLDIGDVDSDDTIGNVSIYYTVNGDDPDNNSTALTDGTSFVGAYGTFRFDRSTASEPKWTYTLGDTTATAAAAATLDDEKVTEVIKFIVYDDGDADGTNRKHSEVQSQDITIHGTNHAPTLGAITLTSDDATVTEDSSDLTVTGAVLDIGDANGGDTIGNVNIYYTVNGDDPDNNSTALTDGASFVGTYGTFRFDRSTESEPKWTYTLGDTDTTAAAVNALGDDDIPTEEIKFIVYDNGDADGNNKKSSGVQSQKITINGANDAPELVGDNAVTVAENATATLTTDDLQFSDAEGDTITYTITALASGGILKNNGADIVVGNANATFTQADVDKITYEHDGSETEVENFKYTVSDGTATTGEQTFTITVTNVNDAPVLVNSAVTVAENATATLTTDDLQFSDAEGNTITYTITALASGGILKNNGADIVVGNANATFTQADVGKITYEHGRGEAASDSFTYSVSDGADTITDQTFAITVTPVNDAPVLEEINGGNDGSVTEDAETTLVPAGNLDITDAEDGFDALTFYATAAGDLDSLDDLANPTNTSTEIVKTNAQTTDVAGKYGKFTFTYTAGGSGGVAVSYVLDNADTDTNGLNATDAASDTVKVIVYDAAGLASEVRGFTVNITGVNDAPYPVGDDAATVVKGGRVSFHIDDLGFEDYETGDSDIIYVITSLPKNGTLKLSEGDSERDIELNEDFTQKVSVFFGDIVYVHGGGANASDSFTYSVSDGTIVIEATFNIKVLFGVLGETYGTATTGNDILTNTTAAAAVIQGGDGDDTITAGSGGDVIVAGRGTDSVTLGAGADVVVQRLINASDADASDSGLRLYDGQLTVTDFLRGTDNLVFVDNSEVVIVGNLDSFATFFAGDTTASVVATVNDSSLITGLVITFAHGGDDSVSTSNLLTINFDAANLQDITESDVAENFTGTTLNTANYDYLDDLLGGSNSLDVITAADLTLAGLEIA